VHPSALINIQHYQTYVYITLLLCFALCFYFVADSGGPLHKGDIEVGCCEVFHEANSLLIYVCMPEICFNFKCSLFPLKDFDGRPCIVCPWHKYKITLDEGEGLYQAVDPYVKPLKPTWRSKGIKQRIHTVTESSGDMFLTLNDSPGAIDSDYYQTEKYRDTILKEGLKKTN